MSDDQRGAWPGKIGDEGVFDGVENGGSF